MADDLRLDQLTRELGWIRGLARALVASDADDLAQDAWLVAAEQAPLDRPLRPWLVRVTTNLARMRGRSATRRARREETAVPEGVPSPAQLVERVELARVVAGEVLALDEPYRSTILLCFFEGLRSVEVAKRLGVPASTVRRRLKVGLDQLRDRLRHHRDPPRGGWLAALAPLAGRATPAKPAAVAAGSSLLLTALALVIAVAGVLCSSPRHATMTRSSRRRSRASTPQVHVRRCARATTRAPRLGASPSRVHHRGISPASSSAAVGRSSSSAG